MRNVLAAALMFVLASGAASGVDLSDFGAVVDFDESLKSLSLSVREGTDPTPDGRLLMLDGVVSAIEVLDAEEASFRARLALVTGEWQGLEKVVMYSAYVDIRGPEFFSRIPTRRNRNTSGDAITTNVPALVIGRFAGITTDSDGNSVPLVEGLYLRLLQ
ncbi:MAG: hypothetical protein GVY14_10260 [Spirochaetes bacterium]|jgi:hypothetical protein|nr:hypothetical protein [Spirochaetota bacterium]